MTAVCFSPDKKPGPSILGSRKLGKNIFFQEDVVLTLAFYDPDSPYVPLNEEEHPDIQKLYDERQAAGEDQFLDLLDTEYEEYYEEIEWEEYEEDEESVDSYEGMYQTDAAEEEEQPQDYVQEEAATEDAPDNEDSAPSEVAEEPQVDEQTTTDDNDAKPIEKEEEKELETISSPAAAKEEEKPETTTSTSPEKPATEETSEPSADDKDKATSGDKENEKDNSSNNIAGRRRKPQVRQRAMYVHSAARPDNEKRPSLRRKKSDEDFLEDDLDDASIGWVQPNWTKKLTLRSSDKGSALRKTGKGGISNLAKPITFCEKDKDRNINKIANQNMLRSTDIGKQTLMGKTLSKPITNIRQLSAEDPRLSFEKPDWTKGMKLRSTAKGEMLKKSGNLERPITFPNGKTEKDT